MPPKSEATQLSEKEKFVLGLAWECFETEPKIDWEKLARLGGYTNPLSAANVVRAAKKKLMANVHQSIGDDAGELASPKTPKGRKRGAGTISASSTPSKGGKGNKKRNNTFNEEDEDEKDVKAPVAKKMKKESAEVLVVDDEVDKKDSIPRGSQDTDDDDGCC